MGTFQFPAPLLQGESDVFPVSDVLLALSRRQVTGMLSLHPSGIKIYLHHGYLDAVAGAEPLGHVLLHMGLLEAEKLSDFHAVSSVPLGLTLVKQGKLELYDLWRALVNQARIGIGRTLNLKHQSFTFSECEALPSPAARLDIAETLVEASQPQTRRL